MSFHQVGPAAYQPQGCWPHFKNRCDAVLSRHVAGHGCPVTWRRRKGSLGRPVKSTGAAPEGESRGTTGGWRSTPWSSPRVDVPTKRPAKGTV